MNYKVNNLTVKINNSIIIKNLNFELNTGDTLYIQGDNGSGKTTLLKALANLIPFSGSISNNFKISYLSHQHQLYDNLSVSENLDLFLSQNENLKALEYLRVFNFKTSDKISTLSKGNQQKVALSIALAREHDLLLLDEPKSNLDLKSMEILDNLISDLSSTKIIVEHQAIDNKNILRL